AGGEGRTWGDGGDGRRGFGPGTRRASFSPPLRASGSGRSGLVGELTPASVIASQRKSHTCGRLPLSCNRHVGVPILGARLCDVEIAHGSIRLASRRSRRRPPGDL